MFNIKTILLALLIVGCNNSSSTEPSNDGDGSENVVVGTIQIYSSNNNGSRECCSSYQCGAAVWGEDICGSYGCITPEIACEYFIVDCIDGCTAVEHTSCDYGTWQAWDCNKK